MSSASSSSSVSSSPSVSSSSPASPSPSPPSSPSSSPSFSLPSSSPSLDSVQYIPITCKSVMHSVSGIFPFKWDINVYRGCEHGCKYCYALYSHQYLKSETGVGSGRGAGTGAGAAPDLSNYYRRIYAKTNIVEQLEKELSRPGRKKELVNFGGVCDSYQPAEKEFELMPEILKLMIKYKNPIVLSTKSDLILRDFDLIDELSRAAFVNIASTVTTMDEQIRKLIEPACVSSERRFKVLKKFKETNAAIGVHTMPILPFLTDSPENLEHIFSKTKEIEADYIITCPLSLRSQTRKYYLKCMAHQFPHLYEPTRILYKSGGLDAAYKSHLYQKIVGPLLQKYELSTDYMRPILQNIPAAERPQKTLFDF